MELELSSLKRLAQMNQEPLAKEAAKDLDGKEERLPAGDPPRVVGADPAAGDYAVNMRMEMKVLAPCMKHREEADGRTQMLGVRRNRQ